MNRVNIIRPPHCEGCPYARRRTVGAKGNPKAPIVIVGEGPGRNEEREGVPFIGDSGALMQACLPDYVNEETDVLFTNAMLCYPPNKKAKEKIDEACMLCHDRLIEEVKAHPRKLILSFGNYATWSLTDDWGTKITQIRGRLLPSQLAEVGILPALHPAALLRGTGNLRQFREDVLYAFDLASGGPVKKAIIPRYRVLKTKEQVLKAVKLLITKKWLAADIETTGLNYMTDDLVCFGVSYKASEVLVFPEHTIKWLRPLLEHPNPRWIWHNGKFDVKFFREHYGIHARVDEDTMLMSYALDEQGGVHGLDVVAADVLSSPDWKKELAKHIPKGGNYGDVPKSILYDYMAKDVSNTFQIAKVYRYRIAQDEALEKLYTKTLIPLSELLATVEMNGIPVNEEWALKVDAALKIKQDEAEKIIKDIAGWDINCKSPQQVAKLLYRQLKLPRKHGESTGKEALRDLPKVPVVKALKQFRKWAKNRDTYITGKRQGIYANIQEDGKVHASFWIHRTRTGRLASSEPNVQNIPRLEALRSIFVARPGRRLIEFDLNQAELRCLAILANDAWLCDLYNSTDRSLHEEMAVHLFSDAYTGAAGAWKHELKMRAKMVNFGIVYGREAPSIAQQFKIPVSEGQRMIDGWFERCPQAHDFIKRCRRTPIERKIMVTPFGRKKRPPIATRETLRTLQNEAANFPHQSIASEINNHSAFAIYLPDQYLDLVPEEDKIYNYDTHIINLVHDSMLLDAPDDDEVCDYLKELVPHVMESMGPRWGLNRVPFKGEWKEGYRWGHLKEG